tara:strand:+ start:1934 stop:2845 length:912 start_codon:yes stop_codon:yes gene_type:complete
MLRFLKVLGTGINGEVCLSENVKTFEKSAIKRLRQHNELEVLKKVLPHKNIVQLVNVFNLHSDVFIVMEVMDMTLKEYIQRTNMYEHEIKWIFKETLTALDHCHSLSILHRDIKPENILLNRNGSVKICDFSLSRTCSNQMTPCVVTLWYRAPELLLGHTNYNYSIDTWSLCCVLLEMIYKRPPFIAKQNSEISQLESIFTALDKPEELKSVYSQEFKSCPEAFNAMDIDATPQIKELWKNLPFVADTFIYDINKRPTCKTLLQHVGECNLISFKIEKHRASFEEIPHSWHSVFLNDVEDIQN